MNENDNGNDNNGYDCISIASLFITGAGRRESAPKIECYKHVIYMIPEKTPKIEC